MPRMPFLRRHASTASQPARELEPLRWKVDSPAPPARTPSLPPEIYSFAPTPFSSDFEAMIDEAIAESERADQT